MKKMILAAAIIALGMAMAAFGIFRFHQIEAKNSLRDSLQKDALPKAKTIEPFRQGPAEDQFLAAQFYLKTKDAKSFEEILTKVIIYPKTPKFWRVRALYNLANLQILKFLSTQDPSTLKNAIFYYQESLRLEPDFWLSKYNLERLILEDPNQQKSQKEKEGKDEKDSEQKEKRQENSNPGLNPPPTSIFP